MRVKAVTGTGKVKSEVPATKPPEPTKKVLSMDVLEKVASGADDAPKSSARLVAEREAFEKMLSDAEKEVAEKAAKQEIESVTRDAKGLHHGKDGRFVTREKAKAAEEAGKLIDKSGGAGGNAAETVESTNVFDVVEYGDKAIGLENHHGVLDVWATHNIEGYQARASKSPTIALTESQHNATKAVYREWLFKKTGKRVGSKIDWKSISPREVHALAEEMFDAADVPLTARENYYREFHKYIYGLED